MTTANEIAADRHATRVTNLDDALSAASETVAYRLDVLLDTLVSERAMPRLFGGKDRTELCKRAAEAAIGVVVAAANLPDEVLWLEQWKREQEAA